MKRIYWSLFMLLMAVSSFAQRDNVIDEIVWIVGDEAIFKSEVEELRKNAQIQGVHWDGDPYCLIPEELAIQKLFINQAVTDSVEATPQEVAEQVNYTMQALVDQYGSLEKIEEYSGMKISDYRATLEESMRNQIITKKMKNKITENVTVTPAEVRRYVKEMDVEDIPFVNEQVEVEIITREPEIPQEEIDAVKADLRNYTERIQSGATTFSTLAILYSEDAGTAIHGGELGFVGRAEVVPEFAAVAFNLTDPGKVSKIVESEYGYHIMQLIEKRGDRVNVRHILRKPKVPEEAVRKGLLELDSIADDIRNEKFTFEEAAMHLSADKATRNNNGLMSYQPDPYTSISKFEMQQLPQEVARAVDRMHVGEISDPFTMVTGSGKQVCAIVKLKSRVNGHKATVNEDFQTLSELVREQKCEKAVQKWIEERQKTTYVKIFEGWNECEFHYPGWVLK